jgi:peptidoglycan/xylan/chitin deacetylase (PgdA/CDA1 family)
VTRPAPRAHWLLLTALLLIVAALLGLNSFVTGEFHADETIPPGPAGAVPEQVRSGGPVVDARTSRPVTVRAKDRTVALTFDDGPDPQWTPRVLEVLARHDVHATFFVTGTRAAQYPGLVRDIVDQGHEIGNHTATHADMRGAGSVRSGLETRLTDIVLAGAAGVRTSLFRPPYSATP